VSPLIRSELLKLRTARSFLVICGLGVGITLLIGVAIASFNDYHPFDNSAGLDQISTASTVLFFTLMLGVLSVTTEYRHGSIAATLLVEPDRRRLLLAKLIATSGVCAVIALVTVGALLAIAAPILSSRDIALGISDSEVVKLIAGVTVAGALTAALGTGLGALVRKQTAAVVGIIVYLLLLEPLITTGTDALISDSVKDYAIGNAMTELTGTGAVNGLDDPLGQVAGGLILLAWAAGFAVIGALVSQNRDVTD
jgi:ABC-2 type transport system permease protein